MAVVPRKQKQKTTYRVAVYVNGKMQFEPALTDKHEAKRLEKRRKREVKAGTYQLPPARMGSIRFQSFAERFFDGRKNRNATSERRQVELHALSIKWFAEKPMDEVEPPDFLRLVKEMRLKRKIVGDLEFRAVGEKSIANIMGTIRTIFGDAHFNQVIAVNPYVLPRGTLKRKSKKRLPYQGVEVLALLSDKVAVTRRVFIWLAFFTGMREGEICGRRWRDWVRDARPISALICGSQYFDRPLKTDDEDEGGETHPRAIPVHPELAKVLNWWWSEGFELVYSRVPKSDDFIFPNQHDSTRNHTKSSGYKLWRKACTEAGVTNHSLHSTRHTFVRFARRGTPRTDAVEAITHNAKNQGEMIDYYNSWLWTPLCEAILTLDYRADANEVHPLALRKAGSGEGGQGTDGGLGDIGTDGMSGSGSAASGARQQGASPAVAGARPLFSMAGSVPACLPDSLPGSSKSLKELWRRRELNPGPQGIEIIFGYGCSGSLSSSIGPCGPLVVHSVQAFA
jgi:integrase